MVGGAEGFIPGGTFFFRGLVRVWFAAMAHALPVARVHRRDDGYVFHVRPIEDHGDVAEAVVGAGHFLRIHLRGAAMACWGVLQHANARIEQATDRGVNQPRSCALKSFWQRIEAFGSGVGKGRQVEQILFHEIQGVYGQSWPTKQFQVVHLVAQCVVTKEL